MIIAFFSFQRGFIFFILIPGFAGILSCLPCCRLLHYHKDGCVIDELAGQQDVFDLITFDSAYAKGLERYIGDPRDLCNVRNLDAFYEGLRKCMFNLKRLITFNDWAKKESHPVIMKVASVRRLQQSLHIMSTEVELIIIALGCCCTITF